MYFHASVLLVFALSAVFGIWRITLIAFLTALCHELAHLFAALVLKEKCCCIAVMPYGCRLTIKAPKKLSHEFLIAAAGPLLNLAVVLCSKSGPLFDASLAMLIINLIPVMPLDGGRMCFCLAAPLLGSFKAAAVMRYLSRAIGVLLLLIGAYAAIVTGFNLSVFIIGTFLLANAATDTSYQKLYYSFMAGADGKLTDGICMAREIVALQSMPARKIILKLSPTRYSVITAVDENGQITGRISEKQLSDFLIKNSARINLGEIVRKELKENS